MFYIYKFKKSFKLSKKKTAIITGVNGQDGAYLSSLLYNKGYNVIGTVRSLNTNFYRLEYFNLLSKIKIVECNFLEDNSINRLFDECGKVDEFYNLAAISFVYSSFYQPQTTFNTNTTSLINILEIIRNKYKKVKLYLTYPMTTGRNFDEILRILAGPNFCELKIISPNSCRSFQVKNIDRSVSRQK